MNSVNAGKCMNKCKEYEMLYQLIRVFLKQPRRPENRPRGGRKLRGVMLKLLKTGGNGIAFARKRERIKKI